MKQYNYKPALDGIPPCIQVPDENTDSTQFQFEMQCAFLDPSAVSENRDIKIIDACLMFHIYSPCIWYYDC